MLDLSVNNILDAFAYSELVSLMPLLAYAILRMSIHLLVRFPLWVRKSWCAFPSFDNWFFGCFYSAAEKYRFIDILELKISASEL